MDEQTEHSPMELPKKMGNLLSTYGRASASLKVVCCIGRIQMPRRPRRSGHKIFVPRVMSQAPFFRLSFGNFGRCSIGEHTPLSQLIIGETTSTTVLVHVEDQVIVKSAS